MKYLRTYNDLSTKDDLGLLIKKYANNDISLSELTIYFEKLNENLVTDKIMKSILSGINSLIENIEKLGDKSYQIIDKIFKFIKNNYNRIPKKSRKIVIYMMLLLCLSSSSLQLSALDITSDNMIKTEISNEDLSDNIKSMIGYLKFMMDIEENSEMKNKYFEVIEVLKMIEMGKSLITSVEYKNTINDLIKMMVKIKNENPNMYNSLIKDGNTIISQNIKYIKKQEHQTPKEIQDIINKLKTSDNEIVEYSISTDMNISKSITKSKFINTVSNNKKTSKVNHNDYKITQDKLYKMSNGSYLNVLCGVIL